MKDDSKVWLDYAEENLEAAQILLNSQIYNPCLQNVQQAVEKSLKAVITEKAIGLRKTHSITELTNLQLRTATLKGSPNSTDNYGYAIHEDERPPLLEEN